MANDRFAINPSRSNCVSGFTHEGVVEFECHDYQSAQLLLTVLNGCVSDIVIDKHRRA